MHTLGQIMEEEQGASTFDIAMAIMAMNPDLTLGKNHQRILEGKINRNRSTTRKCIDIHKAVIEDRMIEQGSYDSTGCYLTESKSLRGASGIRVHNHFTQSMGGTY